MMGLAARYDVIPQNVIRDTTKIETSTPEPKALSVEEARKLRHDLRRDKWAVNGDLPDYAAMVLATGCRAGEVLAIRWEDIDLDAGTVEVNGKIIRHTGVGLVRETTKGRKTTKMLLPDWAVEMLRDRQARDLPSGPLGLVFATATGNPREVRTVDRQMQRFRQRHPEWGDDLVPKKLRKTVATAVERNRGLSAASRQLSHSSQETTAGHYVQRPDIGPDNRAVLDQFAIESGGGK
jgi:integrase